LACIDTGRRNNPESIPVAGFDVDVRHLAEKGLPDVMPSASIPPLANGGYSPHDISKIQEIQQRYRSTFNKNNVTFYLARGKSKLFCPV